MRSNATVQDSDTDFDLGEGQQQIQHRQARSHLRKMIFTTFAVSFLVVASQFAFGRAAVLPRDDNLPARVPYVFPPPGTDAAADTIRARRTNGTLLDLDGVLLQDENYALAWNSIAGVIRDQNSIPPDMRELFILRTAVVNNAAYQWLQHEPVARSVGMTTQELRDIRTTPLFGRGSHLSPALNAALLFSDTSTAEVFVPDNIFNGLKSFLPTNEMIVDAVATVATYNMVSRFVEALNVDDKMSVTVPFPQ